MNLLEHYIKEILSEEQVYMFGKDWVKVKLIVICYGIVEEKTEHFIYEDWQKIKEQGYYLA